MKKNEQMSDEQKKRIAMAAIEKNLRLHALKQIVQVVAAYDAGKCTQEEAFMVMRHIANSMKPGYDVQR